MRKIPPAPRLVRWGPLLAHRWPLAITGALLVVCGTLVAWLMFLQSGGKPSDAARLDQGPIAVADGTLTLVSPPRLFPDGSQRQEVRYEFRVRGVRLVGGCFLAPGERKVGDACAVEYLPADPNRSRVRGGTLHLEHDWLRARFWLAAVTLPGGLLLLGWLTGVFQLRQVLVNGDAAIGLVHRVRRVGWLLPEMLAVDYTFRDHHAAVRRGRHWVRAHGELGARLLWMMAAERYEELPVLHDRRFPHWNRMLLPQDFLPHALSGSGVDFDLPAGPAA